MKRLAAITVLFTGFLLADFYAVSQPVPAVAAPAPYTLAQNPNGLDDTAALQATINSTPDMGCVLFPCNAVYKVSAPLSIYSRHGLTLKSLGGADLVSAGQRGCEFQWTGPAASTFVDVNWSRFITLENLVFDCDLNATPPGRGIRFDQYPDATKPTPTTNCTHCTCRNVLVVAPKLVGTFLAFSNSEVSQNNCEFLLLDGCRCTSANNTVGWGIGYLNGNSYNAKGIRLLDFGVSYANAGIYFRNGNGLVEAATGNGNLVDVQIDSFTNPFVLRFCNFEHSGLAVKTGVAQNGPLLIEGCRWGSIVGPYAFNVAARQFSLRGCTIAGTPPTGQPETIAFAPVAQTGQLDSDANTWAKVVWNPGQAYLVTHQGPIDWVRPY